jgi:hypothetical protein
VRVLEIEHEMKTEERAMACYISGATCGITQKKSPTHIIGREYLLRARDIIQT